MPSRLTEPSDREPARTPSYFTLDAPLLDRGAQDTSVFATDLFWMHVKVYAEGGENELHSHQREEHCFVVLQGEAEFVDGDGEARRLRRFDGALLHTGVQYRFRNVGSDNLVMLRIGCGFNARLPGQEFDRVDADGTALSDGAIEEAARRVQARGAGERFGGDG